MLTRLKAAGGKLLKLAEEPSTWGNLVAATAAGAVLPWPWNLVAFLFGVAKALVPDVSNG
jgi:hypothetical protein